MEELEPVPFSPAEYAEELCAESAWEGECVRRVPELEDVEDDREFRRWQDFLGDLDEMDADDMTSDLADCGEYMDGAGWIEDTQGGAVFIPYD